MRASFGTSCGISATLPASYWYLKWFDPVAMESHVDFFGLMAYDLHGPWDKSIQEIDTLIPLIGVEPVLDSTAMIKYLVWSGQRIGYDDLERIAMKKSWASDYCFGGTMIWSIDLYFGSGSGNTPDENSSCSSDPGSGGGQTGAFESGCGVLVYIDPFIWSECNPIINCEPPLYVHPASFTAFDYHHHRYHSRHLLRP
ncbi:glycoside hydrolase superfamily [Hypoxylon sp. NC1633]|nr:glycoside hydrolase superfamily [Hypoxylon sp. NC1633]